MNTKKKIILVADDDRGILDAMRIMLEEAGYEARVTEHGRAVRDLPSGLPDLILLDLWMSGMNGGDICKHLKSQKKTKHIPVIIFSANKDVEEIAKECRADDCIEKPFDMKLLLAKVAKALKKPRPKQTP
ncbi:MAG: response regulator [Patescibacteria group bacterium]